MRPRSGRSSSLPSSISLLVLMLVLLIRLMLLPRDLLQWRLIIHPITLNNIPRPIHQRRRILTRPRRHRRCRCRRRQHRRLLRRHAALLRRQRHRLHSRKLSMTMPVPTPPFPRTARIRIPFIFIRRWHAIRRDVLGVLGVILRQPICMCPPPSRARASRHTTTTRSRHALAFP